MFVKSTLNSHKIREINCKFGIKKVKEYNKKYRKGEKIMKFYLTKQDVMEKKVKGVAKIVLKAYKEILKEKIIFGENDKEILNYIGFAESLKDFDVMANVFYEAFLDIKNLSQQQFNECLEEKVFSLSDLKGLVKSDSFIKILLFNALIKNKEGDLYEQIVAKMKCEGINSFDAYLSILNELPSNKRKYLELIQDPDFNYNNLDETSLEMLNNYHENFMEKDILPYVTKTLDYKKSAGLSAKLLDKLPSIKVDIELPFENQKKI